MEPRKYRLQQQFEDFRVDKTDGPFDSLPNHISPQDYLRFVQEHWLSLAALAYEGYLQEGKGVLLVDWDLTLNQHLKLVSQRSNSAEAIALDGRLHCPVMYVGERGSLLQQLFAGRWDSTWQEKIDKYDPASMVIVVLAWGCDRSLQQWCSYAQTLTVKNAATPIQAYIENSGRLSEFIL